MPLPLGGGGVVVTPPTPPPTRAPRPADIPTATWTDPAGGVWPMSVTTRRDSPGWFVTEGVAGLDAVPLTFTTDPTPDGGVTVRNVYPGPRLITWPIFVEGSSHGEFLGRWRALARAFTSTTRRGPGVLTIGRPDGTSRRIGAYYQDGYQGGEPAAGVRWQVAALTLMCPDPYWSAPTPTPLTRAYAGAPVSYLSPYPTISPARTLGATVVDNTGDVEAWPTWSITGPAATITAANVRRGESWTLDVATYHGAALGAGETVTVTTRPPSVIGPDGSSWYGALNTPAATLWRLDDGLSDVTFTITGSSTGTTISGTFVPRYETA